MSTTVTTYEAKREGIADLAMKIAITMELHFACSTTTKSKADKIEEMLAATAAFTETAGAPTLASVIAERDAARDSLEAIIDWADFALKNRAEFNLHGVKNLTGPAFDIAREFLASLAPSPTPAVDATQFIGGNAK